MSIRRAVACSGRGPVSTTNFSGTGKDSAVPLDGALWIATQALRAWLLSACPSGTKGIGLSWASHQVTRSWRLPGRCLQLPSQEPGCPGVTEAISARHRNIRNHQVWVVRFDRVLGCISIAGQDDICAQVTQEEPQISSCIIMVFHDKHR